MKKIMIITIAMAFAVGLATAFAGIQRDWDGGHAMLSNGVTDFTGKSYDIVPDIAGIDAESRVAEGASAGGARDEMGPHLYNGATDFTGRSYDVAGELLSPDPADKGAIEGASAGGVRDEMGPHLYNGVTDFTGRSYDTAPELF